MTRRSPPKALFWSLPKRAATSSLCTGIRGSFINDRAHWAGFWSDISGSRSKPSASMTRQFGRTRRKASVFRACSRTGQRERKLLIAGIPQAGVSGRGARPVFQRRQLRAPALCHRHRDHKRPYRAGEVARSRRVRFFAVYRERSLGGAAGAARLFQGFKGLKIMLDYLYL